MNHSDGFNDLCAACSRPTFEEWTKGCQVHQTWTEVAACAPSCRLCAWIHDVNLNPDTEECPALRLRSLGGELQFELDYKISVLPSGVVCLPMADGPNLIAEPDDPASSIVDARPVRDHADDPRNYGMIRHWFRKCVTKHSTCSRRGVAQPVLPSRVIDVGQAPFPQEPYLLETCGTKGRWTALSHRWGHSTRTSFTTTTGNYEGRQKSMPLSTFPPKFRDAVLICRELGIRYLWIDSVCILQDSKSDWHTQSATMTRVYGEAYLTLVAESTENDDDNILKARAQGFTVPENARIQLELHKKRCTFYLQRKTSVEERRQTDYISSRGWCFQETELSSRLLYYCESTIMYRCRKALWEEGSGRLRNPASIWRPKVISQLQDAQFDQKRKVPPREVILRAWDDIVYDYSDKDLTYPSDKLVALSGLASITDRGEGHYLAGIFRHQLPYGLLWTYARVPGEAGNFRIPYFLALPETYRAPSWSWASVDGGVRTIIMPRCSASTKITPLGGVIHPPVRANDDEETRPLCTILESAVTLSSSDPYGQVSGGYVKVRGQLRRVLLGDEVRQRRHGCYKEGNEILDETGKQIHQTDNVKTVDKVAMFIPDREPMQPGTILWYLPIVQHHGLALEDAGLCGYRRIGLCGLYQPKSNTSAPQQSDWVHAYPDLEFSIV